MSTPHEAGRDDALDAAVYASLLVLTLLTVAASRISLGRIFAVTTALAIAGVKASLIGLYFMDLRRERALVHGILWTGAAALAALFFGILPDVGLFP